MTDPSKQVELDAFMGFGDPFAIGEPTHQDADGNPAPPGHREQMTHFVGDDCLPDGHRSEAILPEPDPEPEPAKRGRKAAAPKPELTPTERLIGLIYGSAHDGEPHIITRHLYEGGLNDVACSCKAGTFNLDKGGCWAMKSARTVLGLPAQGD